MRKAYWIIPGIAVAIFAAYRLTDRPTTRPNVGRLHAPEKSVIATNKPSELRSVIEKNKASKDPKVQDLVSGAKLRLAYHAAKQGDFAQARQQFLETAKTYRGTGVMGADYGGLSDQAAYQAAVCLVAEKRFKEAEAEFIQFMKSRPESPLVHACFKRLVRLNGGEPKPEYEALLQSAVTSQEKKIAFESSVCGPKTIEYLLKTYPELGQRVGRTPDYKELAKLCGTTSDGTTVEGMRKGLEQLGLEVFAYKLNRQDLTGAKLPAILLEGDHYVALLQLTPQAMRVYDPRTRQIRDIKIPPLDNPDFFVNLLLFTNPELKS